MIRVSSFRIASSFKGVNKIAPVTRCSLCIPVDRVLSTERVQSTDRAAYISPLQLRALSTTNNEDEQKAVLYEGPFAALTLRLKRVSLTSAVIGIVGLPALSFFYGAADSVPATGQVAVIATAGLTAVGSTVLLGYCFSPYVHTLSREVDNDQLIRMVTRDILAREVVTVFDPAKDVAAPSSSNSRPFCNFMVHGLPFYIHPSLINDDILRAQLVGEEEQKVSDTQNKTKTDDDEFL